MGHTGSYVRKVSVEVGYELTIHDNSLIGYDRVACRGLSEAGDTSDFVCSVEVPVCYWFEVATYPVVSVHAGALACDLLSHYCINAAGMSNSSDVVWVVGALCTAPLSSRVIHGTFECALTVTGIV